MNRNSLLIILIITLIVLLIIFFILYIVFKNKKLNIYINKIKESENIINDDLKTKLDLVTRVINIITRELKIESKKFEEIKKIQKEKINNFSLELILNNATSEILDIKDDYNELSKIKSFDGIISDIENIDISLSATTNFYNKYASLYNEKIKTFPLNIISKIKKYNVKLLYNKDIEKIDFIN